MALGKKLNNVAFRNLNFVKKEKRNQPYFFFFFNTEGSNKVYLWKKNLKRFFFQKTLTQNKLTSRAQSKRYNDFVFEL